MQFPLLRPQSCPEHEALLAQVVKVKLSCRALNYRIVYKSVMNQPLCYKTFSLCFQKKQL